MTRDHGAATPVQTPTGLRLPNWGWDVIVVIVVLVAGGATGGLFMPGPRPPFMHPGGSFVPLVLLIPAAVSAAALLLRRTLPVPVFVFCVVLYCGSIIGGFASIGAGIATVIATFGVASRTGRRTTLITGGVAAATVAMLSLAFSEIDSIDPQIFQVAAGIAVASALGDSARSRRETLIAVTERAERAEQTREAESQRLVAEERLRIAQDLHDTVAHQISVISLNAGVASATIDERPEKAREALGTIRTAARGVLTEIGDLLRYLRTGDEPESAVPPQLGLHALNSLIARVESTGLDVQLRITGDLARVTGSTDLVAYRLVQEGLTNAHKHGAQHRATVDIAVADDSLSVVIANPVAADVQPTVTASGAGLGLVGVTERVTSVRGTVITAREGDTFILRAALPLSQESAA